MNVYQRTANYLRQRGIDPTQATAEDERVLTGKQHRRIKHKISHQNARCSKGGDVR